MLLLMHLSGCPNSDEERLLSENLVNRVVSLRVGRLSNIPTPPLTHGKSPSAIQPSNPRYRALNTMRMRVWEKFKWPIAVVEPSSQNDQVEKSGSSGLIENSPTQGDLTPHANYGDREIWSDWDPIANNTSGIPSDALSWDDWSSLMPDFFADGSYSQQQVDSD